MPLSYRIMPSTHPTARRLRPSQPEKIGVSKAAADETGLSDESNAWLARTPIAKRKALGQFMTRDVIRERLLDLFDIVPGMRILDPGVGTGEFLRSVSARCPDVTLLPVYEFPVPSRWPVR